MKEDIDLKIDDNELTQTPDSEYHGPPITIADFKKFITDRNKYIHDYDIQSETVRKIQRDKVDKIDLEIKCLIRFRLGEGLELTKEMKTFQSFEEMLKYKSLRSYKPNEKPIKSELTEIELLKNERRNSTKIIQNLKTKNKILESQNKNLLKYKRGDLTDNDIQEIVDSTRKKNGKINYSAAGRKLGCTKDTFRKLIIERKLNWLIDSYNKQNPKK